MGGGASTSSPADVPTPLSTSSAKHQPDNTSVYRSPSQHIISIRNSISIVKTMSSNTALAKFQELDVDGSGHVEGKELREYAQWMLDNYHVGAYPPTPEEVEAMRENILEVFAVHEHALTFFEFKELFEEAEVRIRLVRECARKFTELDLNMNGYIERAGEMLLLVEWLLEAYEQFGCPAEIKAKIRDSVMHRFDTNKDGRLSQYEFSMLFDDVCNTQNLIRKARHKFKELDVDGSGYLSGQEIDSLIEYIFRSYSPHGHPITVKEKAEIAQQIIERCKQAAATTAVPVVLADDSSLNTPPDTSTRLYLRDVAGLLAEILEERSLREAARMKFSELDKDRSGFLDAEEVAVAAQWVVQTQGLFESPEAVLGRIMAYVDADGDGRLSLEEFSALFTRVLRTAKLMDQARETFVHLDDNRDGYLRDEELVAMMDWVLSFYQPDGKYLPLEERAAYKEELLRMIDGDNDGRVNLEEFAAMLDEVSTIKRALRKNKGELVA